MLIVIQDPISASLMACYFLSLHREMEDGVLRACCQGGGISIWQGLGFARIRIICMIGLRRWCRICDVLEVADEDVGLVVDIWLWFE